MCSSKKGVSAHQLHRTLAVTYKTAWFMAHRIREAMRPLDADAGGQLGGANKVVEVDETYVGGKARNRKNYVPPKEAVVALVERDGRVRSHHVPSVNGQTLKPILKAGINKASYVMTDESTVYPPIAAEFGGHGHCQSLDRGICPRRLLAYKHGRSLLFDPEARRDRHLSPCLAGAFEAVSRRVRF